PLTLSGCLAAAARLYYRYMKQERTHTPKGALAIVTALTMVRVPLVLLFMAGALVGSPQRFPWLAPTNLALLVVASLSDMFDGMLARRWRVTSTFGAMADPLTDK